MMVVLVKLMIENSDFFKLDDHYVFIKGEKQKVCGNSFSMIFHSRLKDHFEFEGNFERHLGVFEGCGGTSPFINASGVTCC